MREEMIEETNNEVTKTNKYFVVSIRGNETPHCLTGGPYTLKEAMDNAKRWSKDGSVMFVTEAKIKFEVEPKMTKVQ